MANQSMLKKRPTATVENRMQVLLKTKNKSYHMILHSHCWAYSWTKLLIQKDTCITMFTAALFTIAKKWKQPRYPSTAEWINKLWPIYTMEYYSATKRVK